jgi:hypothetical protein
MSFTTCTIYSQDELPLRELIDFELSFVLKKIWKVKLSVSPITGSEMAVSCQPHAPAPLYFPENLFFYFWYLFLLEAE